MVSIQNKIIHRFIRPISDYEMGGEFYAQIIPLDTQAYAFYNNENKKGLFYVFGDGKHTYIEIRDGKGISDSAKEYPVLDSDIIDLIHSKADKDSVYTKDEVYTKSEVDTKISEIHSFSAVIVEELPEVGDPTILYLVTTNRPDPEEPDRYKEYVWVDNKYEFIGGSGSLRPEDLVAENIAYTNQYYSDIQNVKQALDKLLYKEPEVTLEGGAIYNFGETVNTVNLKWNINKQIVSQSLNFGIGEIDPNLREYTITNADITKDTIFTITVNDGVNTASASTEVEFAKKVYWGVAPTTTLSETQLYLFNSEHLIDRKQSRVFDCSGGNYFYFVIPTQYCSDIAFSINSFTFSDVSVTTTVLKDTDDNEVEYSIYRCNNIQHGSDIRVEVI